MSFDMVDTLRESTLRFFHSPRLSVSARGIILHCNNCFLPLRRRDLEQRAGRVVPTIGHPRLFSFAFFVPHGTCKGREQTQRRQEPFEERVLNGLGISGKRVIPKARQIKLFKRHCSKIHPGCAAGFMFTVDMLLIPAGIFTDTLAAMAISSSPGRRSLPAWGRPQRRPEPRR